MFIYRPYIFLSLFGIGRKLSNFSIPKFIPTMSHYKLILPLLDTYVTGLWEGGGELSFTSVKTKKDLTKQENDDA